MLLLLLPIFKRFCKVDQEILDDEDVFYTEKPGAFIFHLSGSSFLSVRPSDITITAVFNVPAFMFYL